MPEIQGQENFSGLKLPASRYGCAEKFQDKDVIVVGNGLSGVEICADLCRAARRVTHIIRRPAWIIPRYLPNPEGLDKIPLDLLFYRRSDLDAVTPLSAEERNNQRNRWFSTLSKQNNLELEELRIDPNSQDFIPIAISDSYLRLVELGLIKVIRASGIKKFNINSVFLPDGAKIKADAVIFATGYKFELPFLADELKSKLQFSPEDQLQPAILYKETFNRDLPGLYFVGTYKGPFFGTMELQARLVAGLASGRTTINDDSYSQGIKEELAIRNALPRPQFPHADYVKFSDGLAKDAGCFPELSFEDPLRHAIFNGPVIPAHYRVSGTGSEREKAEAIIKEINKVVTTKR
ncbi:MAG TPA: SidA/IucD/PvdA family monooxygenase [Oligoflexia bacterium]|nr:SidA/IucD/PvdA family monooxygenase [Oligoflexia bacterium]HMP27693.1 SidA/IucD/PvdA family monooxygenase [Oligoflexia bacterium]